MIHYQDFSDGITTIDTGFVRPGMNASHLIVEHGQAAFVDVGTAHNVPVLLDVLYQKQIPREAVKYVIVTHVHLDHAGAAGALMQHLPNVKLVVHPRGARHLVNPERLIKGTTAVYGEELMQTLFGEVVAVPKERVIEAPHEFRLDLNGRQLVCLDTPGHARHHICIFDEASHGVFTGDTFGVSYREFDTENGNFIFPASAPADFDPPTLHATINQLLTYKPERAYLAHFGCVTNLPKLAKDLHETLDHFVELAQKTQSDGKKRHHVLVEELRSFLVERLRVHGCPLERRQIVDLIHADIEIGAQGLEVWLDRQHKQQQP